MAETVPKLLIDDIDISSELFKFAEERLQRCKHIKQCFISPAYVFRSLMKYISEGVCKDIILCFEDFAPIKKDIMNFLIINVFKEKAKYIDLYDRKLFKGWELHDPAFERSAIPNINQVKKLHKFLKARIKRNVNQVVPSELLYTRYKEWWDSNDVSSTGKKPMIYRSFVKHASSYFGAKPLITNVGIAWIGYTYAHR